MLSKFNYYTGVIFSAYTYGVGDAIAKGGRYNNLLGKYGQEAPAIGFVILLDDLLSALYRQNVEMEHEKQTVYMEFDEESFKAKLSEAIEMRKSGQKVALAYRKA
jgi:ATP phosphoribosyltransferase regulatory subunit